MDQRQLLSSLCCKITGLDENSSLESYKLAYTLLGSHIGASNELNEFQIVEKIKKRLVRQCREKDAAIFSELHTKLKSHSDVLTKPASILYLLYYLSTDSNKSSQTYQNSVFAQDFYLTSTPYPHNVSSIPSSSERNFKDTLYSSKYSDYTSGISTIHSGASKNSVVPQSLHPSQYTPYPRTINERDKIQSNLYFSSELPRQGTINETNDIKSNVKVSKTSKITDRKISKSALLREVIFAIQGIGGEYFHFEKAESDFKISASAHISKQEKKTINKIIECGWLYKRIMNYVDVRSTDKALGLVGQSFCAALHQQLTEYLRLVAVLETQLQIEEEKVEVIDSDVLTLRKLVVWTFEPLNRLKVLAALVDICQNKKGGGLASAIHSYLQHGDPVTKNITTHLLSLVAQPVFITIIQWIYNGELEDSYYEFFVASDPTVKDDVLWHDKFSLRKTMIPSFLTLKQAEKILLTGKSIHFLRHVCHEMTSMRDQDIVKKAETNQVESLFLDESDGNFQNMIDTVYKVTSEYLLEVFNTKYKFFDHIKAIRRYLLLGQGDFIRHLMDLLENQLNKPAIQLHNHNLSSILETAIRSTNAQYDDQDILNRIDVRLTEVTPGDIGWDVFSLLYHVEGPIQTVFTRSSMMTYLRIFNFLWRVKRMEYVLDGVWKVQIAKSKLLRRIPNLANLWHRSQVFASEMIHFIQQVQYYINFEVLECCWDDLLTKVMDAQDLDNIIHAHNNFLKTITQRAFLEDDSVYMLKQLRTIFDLIIKFQNLQNEINSLAHKESRLRQHYEKKISNAEEIDDEEEKKEFKRQDDFESISLNQTTKLSLLHKNYHVHVNKFISMLNKHDDTSLQFLSYRLDFNEYYKNKDPKLHKSSQKFLP